MTLQLQPGAWWVGRGPGGQAVMSGCSAAEEGKCRQRAGLVRHISAEAWDHCWWLRRVQCSVLVLDVISDEDNDVTTTGYLSKYLASAWLCKWQNPIHHQPLHWNYWMEVLYLVTTKHHLYLSAYLWNDTLHLNNLLSYICLMSSKTVCSYWLWSVEEVRGNTYLWTWYTASVQVTAGGTCPRQWGSSLSPTICWADSRARVQYSTVFKQTNLTSPPA